MGIYGPALEFCMSRYVSSAPLRKRNIDKHASVDALRERREIDEEKLDCELKETCEAKTGDEDGRKRVKEGRSSK